MFRSRTTLALVLLLAAGSLTLVVAQSEGSATDDALLQKLDALEKRIISLERTLQQRLTSIEKSIASGGGGGGPSPQLESEANAALAKINTLVNAGSFPQAKTEMTAFMKKYSTTNAAKSARRMNAELSVIGKTAPTDWGIEKWLQGEGDIDLASDKTTLVVFWEVWCPHCKREVPKLEKVYSDLKSDGLQLVGITKINRSATEEGVISFVEENNVSYPVAKENGSTSTYFNVSGVPAAAVVKDGKIIWRGHPARLSETMLKGWL